LKSNIPRFNYEYLEQDYRILQLCDRLSLYVCLNNPGVKKEEAHPWYKEGFKHSQTFHRQQNKPLLAEWLDKTAIKVAGSPFERIEKVSVEKMECL
jgi:hypothetical protein